MSIAPHIIAPLTVTLPTSVAIPGVVITDTFAAGNPGTMAIDLTCIHGMLSVVGHLPASVLTLNVTLAEANVALATLVYSGPAFGTSDIITIVVWNQEGINYSATIIVDTTNVVVSPTPPVIPGVRARRVKDFSSMLMINTHLDFGQYSNIEAVASVLQSIWGRSGVKPLLRDSPANKSDIVLWDSFAAQTGARFVAYIGEDAPANYAEYVTNALAMTANTVIFLEGPNEPDTAANNGLAGGLTEIQAIAAAAAVMPSMAAHGLPVINMSFGAGWTAANDWRGDYDKVGDLSGDVSYANAHTYPVGNQSPGSTILALNADAELAATRRPVAMTEFGYPNTIGQDVVAKYLLTGWADAFVAGNVIYGIYALVDDQSGMWGIWNPDFSPRLAATVLANLLTILADTSTTAETFPPGIIEYTLSGCQTIVIQKSSGEFDILAWVESTISTGQDPVSILTLTLGMSSSLAIIDPMIGVNSTVSLSSGVTSMTVHVPCYPIVIRIG